MLSQLAEIDWKAISVFTVASLGALCFEDADNCYDPNAGCGILPLDEAFCDPVCTCQNNYVPDGQVTCSATCVPRT